MKTKIPRGRNGGRPKLADSEKKEETRVMRIPLSKVEAVKKIIKSPGKL